MPTRLRRVAKRSLHRPSTCWGLLCSWATGSGRDAKSWKRGRVLTMHFESCLAQSSVAERRAIGEFLLRDACGSLLANRPGAVGKTRQGRRLR